MKFIAECGLNHNGNLDLTYELVRQSSFSGADIVKFQLGWRGGKDEMNHLDKDRLTKIINFAEYMDIQPMFSIFTEEAYELIKEFNLPLLKIASRTLVDDYDLVKKMLDDGNNLIISLGMWEKDEMPFEANDKIDYLWCISKYPCLIEDLTNFPKDFSRESVTGYSDHTIGIETALLSISRGAKIIEKHFSLDKSDTTIRDHVLSATPDEFKTMVQIGRELHKQVAFGV